MGFFDDLKSKVKAVAALPKVAVQANEARIQAKHLAEKAAQIPFRITIKEPAQLFVGGARRVAQDLQTVGYPKEEAARRATTPNQSLPSPDRTLRFFGDLAKGVLRAPLKTAVSADLQKSGESAFQPFTRVQRFFLGSEPISNLERQGEAISGSLAAFLGQASGVGDDGKEYLTPEQKKQLAAGNITLGLIAGITDSFFGGKKRLAKEIAETSDSAVLKRLLTESKVPAELVDGLAERLTKEASEKEVQRLIKEEVDALARRSGITETAIPTSPTATAARTPAPHTGALPQRATEVLPPPPSPVPPESQLDALLRDTNSLGVGQELNLDRLNVSPEAKRLINETVEEIRPQLESKLGRTLTNQEAVDLANASSKVLSKAVGREQTLDWEAAMLRTRQRLGAAAESGLVTEDFVKDYVTVKTQAADIARKFQSLSIGADPREQTALDLILDAVTKAGATADEIAAAAKGVDFTDANQAAAFYRRFVKPTANEWIDLVRYNSMLSSPNTHINGAFGNSINSSVVAVLEKALVGGLDFLRVAALGGERKYFVGESGAYLKGYVSNVRQAATRFFDVMRGRAASTNLDTRHMPLAVGGLKGRITGTLAFPMKLLEAVDQFFLTLTESGALAQFAYRESKGVKVANPARQAAEDAAYRNLRQELFKEGQGTVLDAVDQMTRLVFEMKNSTNPILSTVGRFTAPFVKTPMNWFKQGVEFSPVGFTTLHGSAFKEEQLARAMIGTSVFGGAALLLASNRLTWAEPTKQNEKDAFKNAGMQPYSVKLGDTWYSYEKLPAAFAFPFAITAALHDARRNRGADDSTVDTILSTIGQFGEFMADQSYAKSFGDLLSAFQGEKGGWSRFLSNYPQQFVPFRAFGGWFNRLIDESQRRVDTAAPFLEEQIQRLMLNIPWQSDRVPARLGPDGQPLPASNRLENAFLPVRTSEAKPDLEGFLEQTFRYNEARAKHTERLADENARMQPVYDQVQDLDRAGKEDDAQQIVDALSEEDYVIYKRVKAADASRGIGERDLAIFDTVEEVRALEAAGEFDEADALVDSLSDEEYKEYKRVRAKTE